jgi:hypothetical protein
MTPMYNKTAVAKVLGMSFRALRYRIKKLGIEWQCTELERQGECRHERLCKALVAQRFTRDAWSAGVNSNG